jgi:hypothetical protein
MKKILKKTSDINLAITLYVAFGVISLIPLILAALVAGRLATNVWIYILINCALAVPIPYFALKFAAKHLNNNYIVTNKHNVIRPVIKAFILLNGLFLAIQHALVSGITAADLVSVFTIIWGAFVLYKFAPRLIRELTPEEIAALPPPAKEPPLLRVASRMAALTTLGYFFLLILPLLALILLGDRFGKLTWLMLAAYMAVMLLLFKKARFITNRWVEQPENKTKKGFSFILWQIYFVIFAYLVLSGLVTDLPSITKWNIGNWVGNIDGILLGIGTFAFVFKKRLFKQSVWKFIFGAIGTVWVLDLLPFFGVKQLGFLNNSPDAIDTTLVISILLCVPATAAIYMLSFNLGQFEKTSQSKVNH